MNDTSKPKRVLFKLSDVETQDIMYLKFLLDRQFLRAKYFLCSDLMKICQWIVKTIITTHNEDKTTQWYISKISRNYDKDLNYIGTNVNSIDFYLYNKIHWGINAYAIRKCNPARNDMVYLLKTENDKGVRVLESEEFNSFCYSFLSKYFPDYIKSCLQN